jgi:hypothetical protein
MKHKKLIALLALTALAHAKKIHPAEIMGRDLNVKGFGWLGHVGIATATMYTSNGMLQNSYIVIEVLNEPTVAQINSIVNFKSRSRYWGSKYGIADSGDRGFGVILEANHQRWWCPEYTLDTDYRIGKGNLHTGTPFKCGSWRCDTYVWWAFYSQDWNVMRGRTWLPSVLFDAFPYFNDEKYKYRNVSLPKNNTRNLEDVSAEELNDMPAEDFQMIMNLKKSVEICNNSHIH